MNPQREGVWDGTYKIPWDEPAFSRRMLREHLSQDHDLASRRVEWIERQVAWIHRDLLREESSQILDLGCGPGFYTHRLAMLGHHCLGIDFGPASIEYANQNNPDTSRCEFVLGDLRRANFGGPYDLAMILYGELNVFAPDEAAAVLRKACESLVRGGLLIVEVQTPDVIEQLGRTEASEYTCETGLFSDKPHHCRTENQWLNDHQVSMQVFTVTDTASESTKTYQSTTKAWSDADLQSLLLAAGFSTASHCAEWPCNMDSLALWLARRGTV
ncbi:MAG: class I SAM-dependent methyltransferase [Pirellulaceae bacterium]|nr:class I SAM-dependent methyltransferase [Pirellulaceae bacterium]